MLDLFMPNWCLADALCDWLKLTESEQTAIVTVVCALASAIVGYLLGSLNFAIIISRRLLRRDIRAHGSKNAGTTNMLRTYGTKYAVMTMVLDMLKGAVATVFGALLCSMAIGAPIAGFFAIFGHMFPIYYRFKGGKGVATTGMVALMLNPWVFLAMLFVFVVVTVGTRFVSLASIMAGFLYPILLKAFMPSAGWVQLMGFLTTIFVIFMHRENIKRLLAGKESKISFSSKKKEAENEDNG